MLQNQDNEFGHNHCVSCIRLHCKERNACKVIACKLACGMQYHECKDDEHVNLCPNVKVFCINNVNGCPLLLPRNQLGIHLEKCPASVVCCTMEWNRWPMYSRERRQRIPFSETNVHARYATVS
jgi:F-box protein 30